MDYFSKFLRTNQPSPKAPADHAQEFHKSWDIVKNTLLHPDERQLSKGIKSTNVPTHLQSLVDSLVWESTRTEAGGTGACLEYLLKNDVLGTLVRLSEPDQPFGIQAEVLRTVQNMVVLLDEQFLVHSAVHRAILRLLRNCVGDDLQEQIDGRKVMGAAWSAVHGQPSEYEEDLVNLLCILCSRIRTYRELLMIFFHDKHWYHVEPLFSVTEEDEEELEDGDEQITTAPDLETADQADGSSSALDDTFAPLSSEKKPEYEFLLFNYLLRFVHREGHIGDFARAGLLFLMDVAMSPGKLPHSSEPEHISDQSPSDPIDDAALALAEYILDGDFSEVLGAGLGAVYSLLPSKLAFYSNVSVETSTGNVMTLGSSSAGSGQKEREELAKEKSRAMGVEDASNPEFKARLDHFLKLLEFLQDVLRKNNSHDSIDASALVGTAIGQSIIDAVRQIFLENVLYPSILECSDADGSAVAVMSYIEITVRTLQIGPLADLLVNFLVSEDNEVRLRQRPFSTLTLGNQATPRTDHELGVARNNKLRRRKSSAMVLLEIEAPESRKKSEYFTSMGRFTLRDLLLSNLRSHSQPTATSALQLLQSMLLYHSQLTADRILLVVPDPTATSFPHPAIIRAAPVIVNSSNSVEDDTFIYPETGNDIAPTDASSRGFSLQFVQPETTYSTHEREMGLYLTLVSRVDPSHNGDPFSTGYDHYLRDALASIQSQSAYQLDDDDTNDLVSRGQLKHRLNVNDPTLSIVLESLRRFFSNTSEFNIALTGVLATLAIHPDRSLAGWLTFASNDSPKPSEQRSRPDPVYGGDDGDDRSIDFGIETRLASDMNFLPASSMDENSRPVVHAIFHGLVTQLERYRLAVNHFDKFLLERRQGLLFSENLTDALTIALDLTEEPSTAPTFDSAKPPKSKPKASASSSFVSFLTPRKNKATKAMTSSEPSTPSTGLKNPNIVASPFGKHYQETGSIAVEPFLAPVPAATSWTPVKLGKWTADEEDVFTSSGWSEEPQHGFAENEEKSGKPTHVTLSQLLDNVVILEESIKELVAIIHARRSLGIDSIRYL